MTTEITVTGADIAEMATKLETIDGLTDKDRQALAAVFALANEALGDVEGFAYDAFHTGGANMSLNFTMPTGGQQPILIGLLKAGSPTGVRKAGGTQTDF